MTKWILILSVFFPTSPAMTTAEFDSKEACEQAAYLQKLKITITFASDRVLVEHLCVEKELSDDQKLKVRDRMAKWK